MADYGKLLPPPLSGDESFRALASLLNDWLALNPDLVRTLDHIEDADALQLQHFAEWFSLSDEPAWSRAASIEARRSLVAGAVMLHRLKGTPWAVKRVLELIGMGPGTRVIEGGVQRVYDGTVAADGSRLYSGAAWAEYSIEADLGEDAGLDAGTGALIREVLAGIAPARCHLVDVTYRADLTDSVEAHDEQSITVEGVFSDIPSRPRYDGTWDHHSGIISPHDGMLHANGSQTYQGWRLVQNPHRYGWDDSDLQVGVAMSLEDKVGRYHLYNGTRAADGTIDNGNDAPCCIDAPMPIRMTRIVRYNGRKTHTGATLAAGDIVTFLEAA